MPQLKIQYRDPVSLSIHPALKQIPALGDDEMKPIRAGMARGGEMIPPILVTEDGQILSDTGRTHWLCAKLRQLKEVPVCICAAADVHVIILRDVVCRRHLSKGAQLYLCVPAVNGMIKLSKEKALDWARKKAAKDPSTLSVLDPSTLSVLEPKILTLDDICKEFDWSTTLLDQAIKVHKEFEDGAKYSRTLEGGPQDGEIVEMTLKEYYEPKLLQAFIGGEHTDNQPMGLGAILAGIVTDRERNKGKFSSTKNPNRTATLCIKTFSKTIPHYAAAWAELDPGERKAALATIEKAADAMDPDKREATADALKEIVKIYNAAKTKV